MTHPEEGHSEETSEDLIPQEETSEEETKEFIPEEMEEERVEEKVEEEPVEYICDICDEPRIRPAFQIKGYHEKICGQCYDRGLMWCIREAWKWQAQLAIDVLRAPKKDD